jgi:hypothetical protein
MIGLITILIGVFIKEYVYIDYDYYIWIYLALNIVGLILISVGFIYAVTNSNLNWVVWGTLGVALILSIIGNMLAAIYPTDFLPSCIVSIVAFFIYAIALILVLGYGPWAINLDLTLNSIFWFFPFLGLTIIIGILSVIFEGLSLPICNPCDPCNPCGQCNICKPIDPCQINSCQLSNPCGQCNICKPIDLCHINSCHPSNPCGQCNICNPIDQCHSCQQSNPCGQCNICKQIDPYQIDSCKQIDPCQIDSCQEIDQYQTVSQQINPFQQITQEQQINPFQQVNQVQQVQQINPFQQVNSNKSSNLHSLINIC